MVPSRMRIGVPWGRYGNRQGHLQSTESSEVDGSLSPATETYHADPPTHGKLDGFLSVTMKLVAENPRMIGHLKMNEGSVTTSAPH
jgi:hypothetical protein